jgi:hypothetical protein
MKSKKFLCLTFLLCFFVVGCGPTFDQTEIPIPGNTKKNIDRDIPNDFGFFSLRTSCPTNLEELHENTLFICGMVGDVDDIKLQLASIKDRDKILFKSVKRYVINKNVLKGKMSFNDNVGLKVKGKGKGSYPRKSLIFGKDTSIESLLEKCMEEIKNNPKSLLLMERALGKNFQNELLEIVFKDSGEQPVKKADAVETPVKIQPAKLTFHFVSDPDPALDLAEGLIPGTNHPIFYVKEPVLSNKDVAGAKAKPTAMYGKVTYLIEINFSDEGAQKFAQITKDNIGKDLAIVIDGKIIMAPTIQTPILDGKCQIQGRFTKAEAEEVALKINAGRLK